MQKMPYQTIGQGKRKAPFLSDTKQGSLQSRPYKKYHPHKRRLFFYPTWAGCLANPGSSTPCKQVLSVKETIGRKILLFHAFLRPFSENKK